MAMLAEPRRRQKWTLNPRGKHWSEDSNKFGQKMLEKMGWSSGKGLGANLDGMTEHIRARYKNDQAGIGFSHDDKDKQWTEHQEGYNELLQKLHNAETAETSSKDKELSGKSLELKSKQSRARVHYQKFTRGKDVNKYSSKDLANIFGKKDLNEKLETSQIKIEPIEEPEEAPVAPIGTCDSSHGIVTIKGGSITDYFKTKMSSIGRKIVHDSNDSGSETEKHVGFGFSAGIKAERGSSEIEKFSFENPALDISSPPRFAPKRAKTEPKTSEIEKFSFENPALDISSPPEIVSKTEKRKIDYVFENPALDLGNSPSEGERPPKRQKSEFAFVNGGLDLEMPKNSTKTGKIEFETSATVESSINPEETLTKKKRKKKSREILPEVAEGFTNGALSMETREDENSNSAQFEVTRPNFGLANDALDLSDESSGKKRVTFNDTVEYEIDAGSTRGKKKKSKNAAKLDKFEVDNGKLKKKKKKSKTPEIEAHESAFVNDAMDVEILSQEASENAINERKIERERRKRNRRSNLETIVEAEEEKEETSCVPQVVTLNDTIDCESDEPQVLHQERPQKQKKKRKDASVEKIDENSTKVDIEIEEIAETIPEADKKPKREARNEENCIETAVIVEEESSEKKKKRKKKDLVEPEVVEEEQTPEVKKKKKKSLLKTEIGEEAEVEEKDPVVLEVAGEEQTPEVKKKKKKNLVKSEVEKKDSIVPEVGAEENTPEVKKKKKKNSVRSALGEGMEVEKILVESEAAETPEVRKKKKRLLVEPEIAEESKERQVKKEKKEVEEENLNKENVEGFAENTEIESAKKQKKSKKEETKISCETEEKNEEACEILTNGNSGFHNKTTEAEWEIEAANTHAEMQNGLRSPWDGKAKRSKKIFKALFARSPVVHFAGSNINEIQGYGVNFK